MKRLNFFLPLVLTAALVGALTPTANGEETNAVSASPSLSLDAHANAGIDEKLEPHKVFPAGSQSPSTGS